MGCLSVVIWITATIWIWINVGSLAGLGFGLVAGAGLVWVLGDLAKRSLEFKAAWEASVRQPQTPDELSSRGFYYDRWLRARRKSRIPAIEWLEGELQRQETEAYFGSGQFTLDLLSGKLDPLLESIRELGSEEDETLVTEDAPPEMDGLEEERSSETDHG